jgi:SAM-dependent methyltransferase
MCAKSLDLFRGYHMRSLNNASDLTTKRGIELEEVRKCIIWYDTISDVYDELYSNEQMMKYDIIFSKLPRNLDVVLDVGCGTGNLLTYLIKMGYGLKYYVGLDVSSKIISIALRKAGYYRCLTDFIVADLAYPPIRTNYKFDLITLITVLRSQYNVDIIVKEYLSRVKDGGFIVYTVLHSRTLRNGDPKYEEIYILNSSGGITYVFNSDTNLISPSSP